MYMYISSWSEEVYVNEDRFTNVGLFQIKQFPDGNVIVASHAFPSYVMRVRYDRQCTEDHGHSDCTEEWKPVVTHVEGGYVLGVEVSAPTAAMEIVYSPEGGFLMMHSLDSPERYLYIPRMSWQVNTYHGDPGTGGYWVFDPPLPADFQPRQFRGRRCIFDCGGSLRSCLNFMVSVLVLQLFVGLFP
jgi:hypothetical protein